MTLSYLVSTAGHAQAQNESHPHDIQSILQLIDEGAVEFGDEPVVGFTRLTEGKWACEYYSFLDLIALSNCQVESLIEAGVAEDGQGKTVSLLCPTGLDFLIAWLALIRLGYGVVFVAPQCSPSAISHLRTATSSTSIIHHPKYASLAKQAYEMDTTAHPIELPSPPQRSGSHVRQFKRFNPDGLAHIFHTSGTSGTPKPIPYTHCGSVSPLPRRSLPRYISSTNNNSGPSSESAAFTTTPLFHGGVSDLLRAWMARSVICFYPTSDVPITTENVLAAVDACREPPPSKSLGVISEEEGQKERERRYTITAFLSVPYILSTLAEGKVGMAFMASLELVSTGGAPLDDRIGKAMVEAGVRLVSRLGSSECGFLMSSYRDFEKDTGWDWLRNDSPHADALLFEPVESAGPGKREMVVTTRWRSKTKSNRDDGSYATGDLYEAHPDMPNVWRYAGRGDEVVVMSNGEKASPGPIETIIRNSTFIVDALVVGSNCDQLGLLAFVKQGKKSSFTAELPSLLASANETSPTFAQISEDMCLVLEVEGSSKALPKSSKGTIQRGLAYEAFKEEIDGLYQGVDSAAELPKRSLSEIESELRKLILGLTTDKAAEDTLNDDTDLFTWGVNSLMATRLRTSVLKTFNVGQAKLSSNVVFEKPSIERLSRYIHALQEGSQDTADSDPLQLMNDLVEEYGSFSALDDHPPSQGSGKSQTGKTILLTGATGSLGAFILGILSVRQDIGRVICLVRAGLDEQASNRVRDQLQVRGIHHDERKILVLAAKLNEPSLGLTTAKLENIRSEVDVIIHAAWPVHFASSLISFQDSLKSTRNLIDLARSAHRPARFLFCSSLASVLGKHNGTIREQPSNDSSTASPIGYSQSKWVTEAVCLRARRIEGMDGRVSILRVGQLCGDTNSGHWNEKEGWPLLFRTADTTEILPILTEKPSWLPVDIAAQVIIDIALTPGTLQEVYHVVQPHTLDWSKILDHLETAGLTFKRTSPPEWLQAVQKSPGDSSEDPSKQMLSMWQNAYGSNEASTAPEPIVLTDQAQSASPALASVRPLEEEDVRRMVQAWRNTGYLKRQSSHA